GTSVIGGGSRLARASPPVATGDFNGDGKTDIVWYDTSNGDVLIWLMDVATVIGSGVPGSMTTGWAIAGTGDFNGDGFSDILWRNSTTGQVVVWLINGIQNWRPIWFTTKWP